MSFKYGDYKITKGERTFSNFTETTVEEMLNEAGFKVIKCAISGDVREGHKDEKWVNVIARKVSCKPRLFVERRNRKHG